MGLVELENPMEMHPRFWPRTQRPSVIFTRVPVQGKESEKKEREGMGTDKPILQFQPRRIL